MPLPPRKRARVSAGESRYHHLQAIAEGIRAGSVPAYDAFLGELWTPVVRYVAGILGSADDAQDIAQEAFVRVWEQRDGLWPSSSIRAFLYQIARNLAFNEAKRRASQGRVATRLAAEARPGVPTPSGELDRAELRRVVGAAIDALPPRRREAFVLTHLQGLPYREVAQVMEISPQSVANQVSAALADLRRSLGWYVGAPVAAERRQLG